MVTLKDEVVQEVAGPDVPVPPKPASKYTIEDRMGGFVVLREGGYACEVWYQDTYIVVMEKHVGLYCYAQMVEAIAEWFMDNITTYYTRKSERKTGIEMITRALNKRIQPHWRRIVDEFVPPEIDELAAKMWSSVHGDAGFLHNPLLYTEAFEYLRSDLNKYHACRVIARREYDLHIGPSKSFLDGIQKWREVYATSAISPKAFNKTLDKMPRAVSFNDIEYLNRVHLEHPITNRLHLIAVLCGADHHHWDLHERTLLKASPQEIKEAALITGRHLTAQSSTPQIRMAIRHILDFPAAYHGDIVGLAQRSMDWHRTAHYSEDYPLLMANTELPLLDLDYEQLKERGIVPLRTVGEVVEEGEVMHHCVGSYAGAASQGRSFLFHAELLDEKATIELGPDGQIRQAYGPFDRRNHTCEWAEAILRQAAGARGLHEKPVLPADDIPF